MHPANAARILLSGSTVPKQLPQKKARAVPQEPTPKSVTYADAGVDLTAVGHAKERIKYLAQKTFNRNVLGGIGGFGALFRLDLQRWKNPILVSSADGVGTKLKVAFELGLHQTVGADLVNHCVNDIAVQGATPLFFLDYLATGKLDPEVVESVVSGLADALQGERVRADRRRDGADAGVLRSEASTTWRDLLWARWTATRW